MSQMMKPKQLKEKVPKPQNSNQRKASLDTN